MKLDQLRKIIREEVRAAVKEELQDVINEAVKIASSTSKMTPAPEPGTSEWSAAKKLSKQELAEMIGLKTPPKRTNVEFTSNNSINSMLTQTRDSMTNEDYGNIVNGTSDMVPKPNFASAVATQMSMQNNGPTPGLDITQLDFVSKAKAVLDLAKKKDKQRAGQL